MKRNVEFYFDLGSPASYLAYTQLPGLCAQAGAQLVYQPMLLGGVFKATGNASPAEIPAKGRYMIQDLTRYAERYGVPFRFNPYFPVNTLLLMRATTGVQLHQPERFVEFVGSLYQALWVDGRNMNDPGVVAQVLLENGFDPQRIMALTQDEQVKAVLKEKTEQALQHGVFGAPSMFVGEQLFFGQDRLEFVREALA